MTVPNNDDDRVGLGHGWAWAAGGMAVLAVLVLVVLPALRVVVGMGSPDPGDEGPPARVPPVTAATRPVDVVVRALDNEGALAPPAVLENVRDLDVVVVRAVGFLPGSTGNIAVCAGGRCAGHFPVVFDERGRALVQYQVPLGPGASCSVDETCTLQLESDNVVGRARLFTGVAPTRPVVKLARLRDARAAVVTVAGTRRPVEVAVCGRDARRIDECGSRVRTVARRDEPDVALARITLPRAPSSVIAVEPASHDLLASPLRIEGAAVMRPRYQTTRVLTGLGLACCALLAAGWLVRRTDWREPMEAAAPELDSAVLFDP